MLDLPMLSHEKPATYEEFVSTFQQGGYYDIFLLRMREFIAFIPENLIWYIPKSLGLFYAGMLCARLNLVQRIKENSTQFIFLTATMFLLAVFWNSFRGQFFELFDLQNEPIWRPILIFINVLFETIQGFSYIFGFLLIFAYNQVLARLFAKTGRLALTNYILQSIICVTIFYGYGLGYYIQLKPSDLLLITLAAFAVNLVSSHLYLTRFKQGPLEFIWRQLSRTS